MMVANNTSSFQTPFTISIEAAQGVTTGVSAADRVATVKAAVAADASAADLRMPGHMFPLRARKNGVLDRPGHTEVNVDLMRLAGLAPAGVLCELIQSRRHYGPSAGNRRFCPKTRHAGCDGRRYHRLPPAVRLRNRSHLTRVTAESREGTTEWFDDFPLYNSTCHRHCILRRWLLRFQNPLAYPLVTLVLLFILRFSNFFTPRLCSARRRCASARA